MSIHTPTQISSGAPADVGYISNYLDALALVERLHRLLLDVIKDEFERVGVLEINAVQALLLFNIGDNEVTAGELTSRGYYQGSNVSYNLNKMVEMGYMHRERCAIDRRSVRVRLTSKGRKFATRFLNCLSGTQPGFRTRAFWGLRGCWISHRPSNALNDIGRIRSAISIELTNARCFPWTPRVPQVAGARRLAAVRLRYCQGCAQKPYAHRGAGD